jgi:four helix bundle protein
MDEFNFRATAIYKKAFQQAMNIFEITKAFPKEEKYSLIDQIRRSSRSVCANYAEAIRKKKYKKHFLSKLSDCDMENTETLVWLDIALASKYLDQKQYEMQINLNNEVGKLIGHAIRNVNNY